MQIVACCRLFAGVWLVVKNSFAVRDPYFDFSSDHMPFPNNFRGLKKKNALPTDRRTDQPTDQTTNGQTDPHIEMRGRIQKLCCSATLPFGLRSDFPFSIRFFFFVNLLEFTRIIPVFTVFVNGLRTDGCKN